MGEFLYRKTVKKYPKLRCPVCGMIVWLNNLVGNHRIESFVYHFGIGRGKIKIEKPPMQVDLIDFWIQRLEGVIDWLKEQKKQKNLLTYQINNPKVRLRLPVMGVSASMRMDLQPSKSIQMQVQNVKKCYPIQLSITRKFDSK